MTNGCKEAVLSFGHDGGLLMSRQWLLVRAGCEVYNVMRMAEFRQTVLTQPISLIVICQTIPGDECFAASDFATEYAPAAQQLFMYFQRSPCATQRNHVALDSSGGPELFIHTVQQILASSRSRLPAVS